MLNGNSLSSTGPPINCVCFEWALIHRFLQSTGGALTVDLLRATRSDDVIFVLCCSGCDRPKDGEEVVWRHAPTTKETVMFGISCHLVTVGVMLV